MSESVDVLAIARRVQGTDYYAEPEREIGGEEVVDDEISPPAADLSDPAQVEALFGNYGIWDHWRKVVQAQCMELVRAEYAAKGEKVTETRIDSLARLHPNYIAFLTDGLVGRTARERNVRDSLYGVPRT